VSDVRLEEVIKRLGRREAPDPRDHEHPMRAMVRGVTEAALPDEKQWFLPSKYVPLDQGNTGTCVGYSWEGFELAGPVSSQENRLSGVEIYRGCVLVDEWGANDWEAGAAQSQLQFGTSVRAGAKVLQAKGRVGEYVWAFDEPTANKFIRSRGPLVIGVDFLEGMYETDKAGYFQLTGEVLGGHAMLLFGYSKKRDAYRGLNSWGRGWGDRGTGRFWLRREDFKVLLEDRGGECCSALEIRVK
jgi:hypothetical protein